MNPRGAVDQSASSPLLSLPAVGSSCSSSSQTDVDKSAQPDVVSWWRLPRDQKIERLKATTHLLRLRGILVGGVVGALIYMLVRVSNGSSMCMDDMFRTASVCAFVFYFQCFLWEAYFWSRDWWNKAAVAREVSWTRRAILLLVFARGLGFFLSAVQTLETTCSVAIANVQAILSMVGYCCVTILFWCIGRIFVVLHSPPFSSPSSGSESQSDFGVVDDNKNWMISWSVVFADMFAVIAFIMPTSLMSPGTKAILLGVSLACAFALWYLLLKQCYDTWSEAQSNRKVHPSEASFGTQSVYTMASAAMGMLIHIVFNTIQLLHFGTDINAIVCDSLGADRFLEVGAHSLTQIAFIVMPTISLCSSTRLLSSGASQAKEAVGQAVTAVVLVGKNFHTRAADAIMTTSRLMFAIIVVLLIPFTFNRVNGLSSMLLEFPWVDSGDAARSSPGTSGWQSGLTLFGLHNSSAIQQEYDPSITDVSLSWLEASLFQRWVFTLARLSAVYSTTAYLYTLIFIHRGWATLVFCSVFGASALPRHLAILSHRTSAMITVVAAGIHTVSHVLAVYGASTSKHAWTVPNVYGSMRRLFLSVPGVTGLLMWITLGSMCYLGVKMDSSKVPGTYDKYFAYKLLANFVFIVCFMSHGSTAVFGQPAYNAMVVAIAVGVTVLLSANWHLRFPPRRFHVANGVVFHVRPTVTVSDASVVYPECAPDTALKVNRSQPIAVVRFPKTFFPFGSNTEPAQYVLLSFPDQLGASHLHPYSLVREPLWDSSTVDDDHDQDRNSTSFAMHIQSRPGIDPSNLVQWSSRLHNLLLQHSSTQNEGNDVINRGVRRWVISIPDDGPDGKSVFACVRGPFKGKVAQALCHGRFEFVSILVLTSFGVGLTPMLDTLYWVLDNKDLVSRLINNTLRVIMVAGSGASNEWFRAVLAAVHRRLGVFYFQHPDKIDVLLRNVSVHLVVGSSSSSAPPDPRDPPNAVLDVTMGAADYASASSSSDAGSTKRIRLWRAKDVIISSSTTNGSAVTTTTNAPSALGSATRLDVNDYLTPIINAAKLRPTPHIHQWADVKPILFAWCGSEDVRGMAEQAAHLVNQELELDVNFVED